MLEPSVTDLRAVREAGERKDRAIRELERDMGRLTAGLEAARATGKRYRSERDAAERSRHRDVRRLSIALAVAGALAIAAARAPAWVRQGRSRRILASVAIIGPASGGCGGQPVGRVLGLGVLLLWSGLASLLGWGVGPVRPAASEPTGEAGVVRWLAAALVGLGLTLLWGDQSASGVPLLWATILPAVVAYSALLFDAGRARR